MPNCFQLFEKGTYNAVALNKLDDIICREILHCEPHPKFYGNDIFNWFDSIGFLIAVDSECSLGSEKLRNKILHDWFAEESSPEMHEIAKNVLNYLEEHYVSNAFYMSKS